jgi:hypothetical protein
MMDKDNKERERKNTQNGVSRKAMHYAMQPHLLRHVRQMALAFALS